MAAAAAFGCAKPRLQLPSGPTRPLADPTAVLAAAFDRCGSVRTISLELGLSGRAGREKLRGRLLAGLARPSAIRLEAVAPFGQPGFILAAAGARSILLLPRDDRVLRDAPPEQILAALAGVAITPDELLAFLAGCPASAPRETTARAYGADWAAVDLENGAVAYLRRASGWRTAAVVGPRLRVTFEAWGARHPLQIRLQSPPGLEAAFDLLQNATLPPEAFTVDVPPDAEPITLDELRRSGPMRDTASDQPS
jgi:hypothetical protein